MGKTRKRIKKNRLVRSYKRSRGKRMRGGGTAYCDGIQYDKERDNIIGEGGTAKTYRSNAIADKSKLVVKLYDSDKLERGAAEYKIVKAMITHPNLGAQLKEITGYIGGTGNCLVYKDKGDELFGIINSGKTANVEIACTLFSKICNDVAIMHDAGYGHFDISPGNICVPRGKGGGYDFAHASLIDFGGVRQFDPPGFFSKVMDARGGIPYAVSAGTYTPDGTLFGTWAFMAPECDKKKRYSGKARDMFAIGGVLYATLVSHFPSGSGDRFREFNPTPAGEAWTDLDSRIKNLIINLMGPASARHSAEEALAILQEILQQPKEPGGRATAGGAVAGGTAGGAAGGGGKAHPRMEPSPSVESRGESDDTYLLTIDASSELKCGGTGDPIGIYNYQEEALRPTIRIGPRSEYKNWDAWLGLEDTSLGPSNSETMESERPLWTYIQRQPNKRRGYDPRRRKMPKSNQDIIPLGYGANHFPCIDDRVTMFMNDHSNVTKTIAEWNRDAPKALDPHLVADAYANTGSVRKTTGFKASSLATTGAMLGSAGAAAYFAGGFRIRKSRRKRRKKSKRKRLTK